MRHRDKGLTFFNEVLNDHVHETVTNKDRYAGNADVSGNRVDAMDEINWAGRKRAKG